MLMTLYTPRLPGPGKARAGTFTGLTLSLASRFALRVPAMKGGTPILGLAFYGGVASANGSITTLGLRDGGFAGAAPGRKRPPAGLAFPAGIR